jgi:hypothetical protein
VVMPAAGLLPHDTHAHHEPSRSCRSHASRCPTMPPVSSTSGGAYGACPPTMAPVCEIVFDESASARRPLCDRLAGAGFRMMLGKAPATR